MMGNMMKVIIKSWLRYGFIWLLLVFVTYIGYQKMTALHTAMIEEFETTEILHQMITDVRQTREFARDFTISGDTAY